jgi:hypothetical protein
MESDLNGIPCGEIHVRPIGNSDGIQRDRTAATGAATSVERDEGCVDEQHIVDGGEQSVGVGGGRRSVAVGILNGIRQRVSLRVNSIRWDDHIGKGELKRGGRGEILKRGELQLCRGGGRGEVEVWVRFKSDISESEAREVDEELVCGEEREGCGERDGHVGRGDGMICKE